MANVGLIWVSTGKGMSSWQRGNVVMTVGFQ